MIKIFTQHDLIRYLYRETSEKEDKEINNALLCDSELMAMYNDLREAKQRLDDAKMEPSPNVILNILSYSKAIKAKE